jgi:hypothetical protein
MRKQYTAAFKAQLVHEVLKEEKPSTRSRPSMALIAIS